MDNSSDKNIKEDFCPVCIASVPLAFALVSSSEDNHEQKQEQEQKHKKKRSSSNYIYPLLFIIFCIAVFYYFKK
jgi:Na+/H+ antiporter NhaC